MSLRIAPASSHAASTSNTNPSKLTSQAATGRTVGAPSAPGLPDTLRASHTKANTSSSSQQNGGISATISSTHPLEARLANWQSTQATLHNNILRRNFGVALPLRIQMEQSLVAKADGFRPSALGPVSGVHADILAGRDTELQWEDVYNGQDGLKGVVDQGGDGAGLGWSNEMEKMVGMGKW